MPAQILSHAQTLLPGLTADVLRISNALLPEGSTDDSMQMDVTSKIGMARSIVC